MQYQQELLSRSSIIAKQHRFATGQVAATDLFPVVQMASLECSLAQDSLYYLSILGGNWVTQEESTDFVRQIVAAAIFVTAAIGVA